MTAAAGLGINVIGHVSGNLGLGVVARNLIGLAQSLDRPVATFDVEAGAGRSGHDRSFDALGVAALVDLPHPINVFVVGLAQLDAVLATCPPAFFDGSRLNAIVCFWELPLLPPWGVAALDRMDVVVAATDFMEAVFRQQLTRAAVIPGRIPVTPPVVAAPWDRAAHGIPADAVVFVCGFEPSSDPARKNPFGVIEAFRDGVGARDDAHLLVRINNAFTGGGRLDGIVAKVERAAGGHPRVHVLTEPMSYPQVVGLYRDAQVYVSLHRAEGLGLGMAEAMLMERPVIATGWSGNMSFMGHASACLVGYRLIPVAPTVQAYRGQRIGRLGTWADARLDEAAALMRLLADDSAVRARFGREGATAMKDYNRRAARGAFLGELEAIVTRRQELAGVGYDQRRAEPSYATAVARPPSAWRRAWWRVAGAFRPR